MKNSISRKLKRTGQIALMSLLIVQISCVKDTFKSVGNLNIYQPSILNLKEGVPIQTIEGKYTPQVNETWHSDKRFRLLEREIYGKHGEL